MGYSKKSQKGFTIIEVSLVLAIGALIFLVVFLAVPALQRNSRNDARKRDVSNIVTAAVAWTSDNPTSSLTAGSTNQVVPSTGKGNTGAELGKYIDAVSKETESVKISAAVDALPSVSPKKTDIVVYVGNSCSGTKQVKKGSARQMAVVGSVETAAGTEYYCLDAN